MEDLGLRLEEAGGANSAQSEISRRRETELNKLKRELEVANTNHDQEASNLRKKNSEILQEFQEQVDQINKVKAK